jgi:hypothetical protein
MEPMASRGTMNNTIGFKERKIRNIPFQTQLYCSLYRATPQASSHFCNKSWAVQLICIETTTSKAFKSIMSHSLQQVLGGTIDLF